MKRIAVIGAGISGLTVANLLKKHATITLFEADSRPGGLIKCERIKGSLFHICGGHVFNSKRKDVLDLFWSFFDRDNEFRKSDRNAVVMFKDRTIPYPVENNAYMFDDDILSSIIHDMLNLSKTQDPQNFEEFLRGRFGETLYNIYFGPYNSKIWRRSLSNVPLSWLKGKLPMPSPHEILFNNIRRVQEKNFVHSSFWYEKINGSQFIADRMSEGLKVRYNVPVEIIQKSSNKWKISDEEFDYVIYCGNIKQLPTLISNLSEENVNRINALEYHGTTSVFCEIDKNPYSWIYLPNTNYDAHRIICTGNFSPSNNSDGRFTATVEFTDSISEDEIRRQLNFLPLHPRYITHRFNKFTYPIQDAETRQTIALIKKHLRQEGIFLTGRFADWEYYNMDVAMGAAMDLTKEIIYENF